MAIAESALEREKKKTIKEGKKQPGFFGRMREKAKERLKDELSFRKEVSTAKKKSFRKAKIVEARREGKERAKRKPFGGLTLGSQLQKPGQQDLIPTGEGLRSQMLGSPGRKRQKSNMEKMMGL